MSDHPVIEADSVGYTEEKGYLINPEMKDEIDRIVASL